ncbi:MAG: response regulator transcription factor [Muribaculaceae bacterium]
MNNAMIVTSNTLQALGLKYLLSRYFGIESTLVSDITSLATTDTAGYALFFADADAFAIAQEFFIPRRARTILMTCAAPYAQDIAVLDMTLSTSDLVERLQQLLDRCHDSEMPSAPLSQREVEVLSLVAKGHINKQIADELSISLNTVLSHRKNITSKLGIRSVSGLAFYAMMHGYVSYSDL